MYIPEHDNYILDTLSDINRHIIASVAQEVESGTVSHDYP